MKVRYDFLKDFYNETNKNNYKEFIAKCKLFLATTNKLIQRRHTKASKKLYRGIFNEIAVLMVKTEKKFKKLQRHSISLFNCESTFQDKINTAIIVNHNHKNIESFLNDARSKTIEFLRSKLINSALKVCTMLTANFDVKETSQTMYFYTTTEEIFKSTKLKNWFQNKVVEIILNRVSTLELGPSNLSLAEIVSLSIYTYNFQPAQISWIGSWIKTPPELIGRRAILNLKNNDNLCLLHCLNAFENRRKINADRVNSYPPLKNLNLNLSKITFPMKLADVAIFEKNNKYSINVFGLSKNKSIEIWHKTNQYKEGKHVNLFLIENEDKSHFALITNMSHLFARQLGYRKWHKFHCDCCLLFYKSYKIFKNHRNDCLNINKNPIKFPKEDYIYFKNVNRQIKKGFTIYSDCESFLTPSTDGYLSGTIQKHELFSVGLYVQSNFPDLLDSRYEFYRGPRAGEWFAEKLIHYGETINHILKYTNHKIEMNTRDKLKFLIADKCYLCDKPFTKKLYKVKEHCHLTGTQIFFLIFF